MKIGFDAKRAFQNRTGLGNYSRYVIDGLCRSFPEHRYVAYAPHRTDEERMWQMLERYDGLEAVFPGKGKWPVLWRLRGLCGDLVRDKVDLFHGLTGELPLTIQDTGIPAVVTVHDLIFLRFPQYYSSINRCIYTFKMRRACRVAKRVIAVSECTKRDIVHYFGISADKIRVVYQGCAPEFKAVSDEETEKAVLQRYNLPNRFVLCVGSIEERKNAGLLIRVLPRLPKDVVLVLVGRRTSYTDRIEKLAARLGVAARLRVLTGVPFADLPALYRLATVFAYPSRYEGFGIPVLEALRSGVPVLAATGSCLEEAGGKAAQYVRPDDTEEASGKLLALIEDEALRRTSVEEGFRHAALFNEEIQMRQIMECYEEAMQDAKG